MGQYNGRSFDMLVDQVNTLMEYFRDLHQRVSKIEGILLTIVGLFGSGTAITVILYIVEKLVVEK